jgi:hypothetical protein
MTIETSGVMPVISSQDDLQTRHDKLMVWLWRIVSAKGAGGAYLHT